MNFNCLCKKVNFKDKNYSYWENRITTSDEKLIIRKLNNKLTINKKILHIGIGNSEFGIKMAKLNDVTGITISKNEIEFAKSLKIRNYKTLFCDKYSSNFIKIFKNQGFDLIIDTNLKSYSCCENAFKFYIDNLFKILIKNGSIITTKNGMRWYKQLKPKLSFNFKKFFYYKMKEIKGNPRNILKMSELEKICSSYGFRLLFDKKLCYLTK